MDKNNIKKERFFAFKSRLQCRLLSTLLSLRPSLVLRSLSLKLGAMSDSKKSTRMGYLPDEILTHIFTFLPIKSIIICTSVDHPCQITINIKNLVSCHVSKQC